jgi:hypothetical protein
MMNENSLARVNTHFNKTAIKMTTMKKTSKIMRAILRNTMRTKTRRLLEIRRTNLNLHR